MMFRSICGALLLLSVGSLGCGGGDVSGAGGSGGTMMIDPGPSCIAFCAQAVGVCEAFSVTEASCRQGCEENLAEERAKSEACGDAVEAVFQCATELDCQGVYDWRDKVPRDDYPCLSTVNDVGLVCPQS